MTLPASGAISMGQVNTELSLSPTALIALGQTNVRTLAGIASGAIDMNSLHSKSAVAAPPSPTGGTTWGVAPSYEALLGGWEATSISWSTQFSKWVVTCGGAKMVVTSANSIDWVSSLSGVSQPLKLVCSSPSVTIALGNSAYTTIAYTSTNGTSWTDRSASLSGLLLYGMAYNGSVFCLIAQTSTAYICKTTTDGITWTDRPNFATVSLTATGGGGVGGMSWTGTKFVAVQSGNAVYSSTDGITWSVSNTLVTLSTPLSVYAYDIAGNGNTFVVVGDQGHCARSTDGGSTWAMQSSLPAVVGSSCTVKRVIWAGIQFVAITNTSKVATSPDGITWTNQTDFATKLSSYPASALGWNGSLILAAGAKAAYG